LSGAAFAHTGAAPALAVRFRSAIQVAPFSRIRDDEVGELEAVLRELWAMEQKKE